MSAVVLMEWRYIKPSVHVYVDNEHNKIKTINYVHIYQQGLLKNAHQICVKYLYVLTLYWSIW